jgi:hypothetical protein
VSSTTSQWARTTDRESLLVLLVSHAGRCVWFIHSVQGERYFSCLPNYGVFVRLDKVKIGDFPVEEIDLEEM